MIIVVANSKGGVGKSTLSVHLAAWLAELGYRVVLADCDTQQSSSLWTREAAPAVKAIRFNSPDEIIEALPELASEADYVICDAPGAKLDTSFSLLLRADLAVVPCKAGMLEIRALTQATRVLRNAQSVRLGPPRAVLVLSMVGKNYRLTQDMRDAAAKLDLPIADTPLTLRQIYADAPGQAALVWNMGTRAREAAKEVQQLCQELLPDAASASQHREMTHHSVTA